MKRTVIAAIVAAVSVAACGSSDDTEPATELSSTPPSRTAIQVAANACGNTVGEVSDEGRTIVMDTPGEDDYGEGDSLESMTCVLEALDIPAAVTARMEATRALDGMQDATWGDIEASWTYHPDNGLNVIITEVD